MTPKEKEAKNPADKSNKALMIRLAFTGLFFAAGLALGTYYSPEITVYWRGFFPPEQPLLSPAPSPSVSAESAQSVISLPQLEQPLPLVYSDTLDEPKVQEYLKRGAVVLPLGTAFGEEGNVVVTAHSSGTQSFGPYRFAFSKLAELKNGDEFTVQTEKGKYTYKVYGQDIVWPHEVDKLPKDERSTVTLVTCWPLWTNYKRLLVHSELVRVDYER